MKADQTRTSHDAHQSVLPLSLTQLVTLSVFSMKNNPFSVVSLSRFIINTLLFSLSSL